MYTLSLLDVDKTTKLLDASIPANLSFVDKPSAVNYAVRHIDRAGHTTVTIDDTNSIVEFNNGGEGDVFYAVVEIIDIRTTQYSTLVALVSPKFNGQRMVVSTEELDDICSVLLYGFADHALVQQQKRTAVAALLVGSFKPALTAVSFSDLSNPVTYTDPVALNALLKPSMVTV